MIEVSFRFYGRLNDFLPVRWRGSRIIHQLRTAASVKDTIEALGVPHPEVDFVAINGSPHTFEARLHDGDVVAVYPEFRSIEIDADDRVGIDPERPVRFALDIHLQKLASRLRLAGFDAVVIADDAALAETGAATDRIVLTRDVALLKRKAVRHGYWVRHTDPDLQLSEILERFDLTADMQPFARCSRCNTLVVPVDPDMVAGLVPARTWECVREFHWCPGCNQVYWRGSHYERLVRLVELAKERARANSR
jgi:uncharacterized protein with PIN domain